MPAQRSRASPALVPAYVLRPTFRKQAIIRESSIYPDLVLRYAFTILIAAFWFNAQAQTSASVSLVSDYRFRGISLSDGKPEPQVNLGYDSPPGWYVGAFASPVTFGNSSYDVPLSGYAGYSRSQPSGNSGNDLQFIGYAGYSRRLSSGLSWDVGATESLFVRTTRYNYAEVYVGLASDHLSGKIYLAPKYYGFRERTLYAELNGAYPLQERLNLIGHIGFLRVLSDNEGPAFASNIRFDTRLGISASLADWNLQLAWVATGKNRALYLRNADRDPNTVILSASYSF